MQVNGNHSRDWVKLSGMWGVMPVWQKPDSTSISSPLRGERVTVNDADTEEMRRLCSKMITFELLDPAVPEAIDSWIFQVNEPTNCPFYFFYLNGFQLVLSLHLEDSEGYCTLLEKGTECGKALRRESKEVPTMPVWLKQRESVVSSCVSEIRGTKSLSILGKWGVHSVRARRLDML